MVAIGLLTIASDLQAQARASEAATVSQTVNGAVITIAYNRPSLRGRSADSIFGVQVEWGHIWTPGANNSTTLSTSKTIIINGTAVAAGKYGLWLEVRRDSSWLLHFHPDTVKWHLPEPARTEFILSIPVRPARVSEARETLSWDFERIRASTAQMRMHWGRTVVPFDITVESSVGTTIEAALARRYEGAWVETLTRDTTRRRPFTITYDSSSRLLTGLGPPDELPRHGVAVWGMVLLPRSQDIFVLGYTLNGEIAQTIEPGQQTFVEFTVENGRATSYVRRNAQDRIVANAVRGTP